MRCSECGRGDADTIEYKRGRRVVALCGYCVHTARKLGAKLVPFRERVRSRPTATTYIEPQGAPQITLNKDHRGNGPAVRSAKARADLRRQA